MHLKQNVNINIFYNTMLQSNMFPHTRINTQADLNGYRNTMTFIHINLRDWSSEYGADGGDTTNFEQIVAIIWMNWKIFALFQNHFRYFNPCDKHVY